MMQRIYKPLEFQVQRVWKDSVADIRLGAQTIVAIERTAQSPALRDVMTINQHVIGRPQIYEMAGRLLLGLEPLRWLF